MTPEPLDHIGGLLCLDFANTVGPRFSRPDKQAHDYLTGFADLLTWSMKAGTVTTGQARSLKRRGDRDPRRANAVLRDAIVLREAIFEVFAAIARRDEPPPAHLASVQANYTEAMSRAILTPVADGVRWQWAPGELDCVLWPVAESAVTTAIGADFGRIKQCPGHDGSCGWLFHDFSKNSSRRWCSMRACGTWTKNDRQTARRTNR